MACNVNKFGNKRQIREFETNFLKMVQQATENLHILECTNEMFSPKNAAPITTATNLAFRTMAESYLDRNSLAIGCWLLSKLCVKAPILGRGGNSYVYDGDGHRDCNLWLEPTEANRPLSAPLCLPAEIYRVFQGAWLDILNEALNAFACSQKDRSRNDFGQRESLKEIFPDAVESKLKNLLRYATGDIDQGLRLLLSTFMQNIDIEVIDAISCEKYEGSNAKCQLAIISNDTGLIPFDDKSQLPFTIENVRALRKQAEMGSGEMCLALSQKDRILYTRGLILQKKTFCPIISIDHPMSWRFLLPSTGQTDSANVPEVDETGGFLLPSTEQTDSAKSDSQEKPSAQFCRNAYSFSLPPLDDEIEKKFFCQLCQKHFWKLDEDEAKELWDIVSDLRKNAYRFHGASILIAENAKEEATRLCSENHRGYRLGDDAASEKSEIVPYLSHLASIDGALIFSPAGKCEGFATILDGMANPQAPGNPARGARYNSARSYLYNIAW